MYKIINFKELNSTNKYALEHIKELDENDVISAQTQTNGRGRLSHIWISDKKDNCYISLILKPDLKYQNSFASLTQYLCVVSCKEFEKYGIKPEIKWPNDVLVNKKKISGILAETSFNQNKFNGLVLGIGVNLNLTQQDIDELDIPATALNLETGYKINAEKFIRDLCDRFFEGYECFLKNNFISIKEEYLKYTTFLGNKIRIRDEHENYQAIALSINDDGSMDVILENGNKKTVWTGNLYL